MLLCLRILSGESWRLSLALGKALGGPRRDAGKASKASLQVAWAALGHECPRSVKQEGSGGAWAPPQQLVAGSEASAQ